MRKLNFPFCVLLFHIGFSLFGQTPSEYEVDVSDSNYIPSYNSSIDNYIINPFLPDAADINNLISQLLISDVVHLNTIYSNLGSPKMHISFLQQDKRIVEYVVGQLVRKYNYYTGFKEITVYPTLTLPDDFETIDPSTQENLDTNTQEDLTMINAEDAWGISTGNENVFVGIADRKVYVNHPDLFENVEGGVGNYDSAAMGSNHGTLVTGLAGAVTNNSEGISSIGYNSSLLLRGSTTVQGMSQLSEIGANVVNGSFGRPTVSIDTNSTRQQLINEMVENGTVVVCAAGNGPFTGGQTGINGIYTNEQYASRYYLPASFKNVISVTTCGNKNEIGFDEDGDPLTYDNWKDVHLIKKIGTNYSGSNVPISEKNVSMQHNDSVDIVAPAFRGSPYLNNSDNPNDQYLEGGSIGTSVAAPLVAGTIGLMFSVNYCLEPSEIETILKLTAVKIDTIPENLPFYGRLGAGRLDAYQAVKMAKDMKDNFGTVEVKDRILYRPWFYKLATAPYEIKMFDNSVSGSSKLKFRARNNIEMLSGEYFPETGYIDLQIDSSIESCEVPLGRNNKIASKNKNNMSTQFPLFALKPTLVDDYFVVQKIFNNPIRDAKSKYTLKMFDLFNQSVLTQELKEDYNQVNLSNSLFQSGLYIVKIYDESNNEVFTKKIVMK